MVMNTGPASVQEVAAPWAPHRANVAGGSEKAPLFMGMTHIFQESPVDPNAALTAGPAALERGGGSSLGP